MTATLDELAKAAREAIANMHEPTDEERQTCSICGAYIQDGRWMFHVSPDPNNHPDH